MRLTYCALLPYIYSKDVVSSFLPLFILLFYIFVLMCVADDDGIGIDRVYACSE